MAIAGLDATGMLELAALLVVTGALAGFLAGVFGIGSSDGQGAAATRKSPK